eukprot:402549_1
MALEALPSPGHVHHHVGIPFGLDGAILDELLLAGEEVHRLELRARAALTAADLGLDLRAVDHRGVLEEVVDGLVLVLLQQLEALDQLLEDLLHRGVQGTAEDLRHVGHQSLQ